MTPPSSTLPIAKRSQPRIAKLGEPLPWFLLGCAVFLYLHLFKLPWTPIFFAAGGEQVYLVAAMRMLDGQVIYRDFFDFLPPGTHVLYFILLKIFGIRAWIPNAMLIGLGVGLVGITTVTAKRLLTGPSAYLPGLMFLTYVYRLQLDATHHWYSALSALAALAVVIDSRSPGRLLAAGALCGLASFFTQTRGAMAALGIAAFLVWEARKTRLRGRDLVKNEVWLGAGFCLTLAALLSYFAAQAGLGRLVDCTVVFLLKYSTTFPHNNWSAYLQEWPGFHQWYRLANPLMWLFMHLFQPVVYLLGIWVYRRESARNPQAGWDRWMLIYLFGLALLLGTVRAPNSLRLAADSLPALILAVWLVDSAGRARQAARWILWASVVPFALLTPASAQSYSARSLDLPTGRLAFYDTAWIEPFEWLRERSQPGDYCLSLPYFNFYLELRDPSGVPFLTSTDFTRPEHVAMAVEQLGQHKARFVIWWPDEGPDPGSPDATPRGDHLGSLRVYVREHYSQVRTFVDGQASVWERHP